MSANDTLEGIGVHHMWGFSQAFNLQHAHEVNHAAWREASGGGVAATGEEEDARPLSILLSQPSDIRHVLKTLSQRRRYSRRP